MLFVVHSFKNIILIKPSSLTYAFTIIWHIRFLHHLSVTATVVDFGRLVFVNDVVAIEMVHYKMEYNMLHYFTTGRC